MASQSILRAGIKSPAHALIRPGSAKSILKRPAPLPLSPNPLPFAASFSVIINSSHLSPHVHFPSSPALAATFSAYSPNTYDRGPIAVSPGSAGISAWSSRSLSSPAANASFTLLDPPKPKNAQLLMVPTFEDPRSPKPFKDMRKSVPQPRSLTVPAFEDPRSPKPFKEVRNALPKKYQTLTVPAVEDPRSPKPYKPRAGVSFEELTLHVPRGTRASEGLAKALSTYPRSPYPSAPLEEIDGADSTDRGRFHSRAGKENFSLQTPQRARSLDKDMMPRNSKKTSRNLTPVPEATPRTAVAKPAPAPLDLETEFWESVSLEEPESAYLTANETMSESVASPVPNIMFGDKDGQLWSPRVPRKDMRRRVLEADLPVLSPAQKMAFSKGMIASPSPNDPFAAFPSFSIAMMQMDGAITYPPRARVEQ
ncbi:hypothetical protein H0H92_002896 [Tricholoma furcatifolium]|nr:hypothetical protein H0H92_002896 [Tricholoma furcatifolium]